jgi:hypothetical protein
MDEIEQGTEILAESIADVYAGERR